MPRDIVTIRRRGGLFVPPPVATGVVIDSIGNAAGALSSNGVTSFTTTPITVGAGHTNTALVVVVANVGSGSMGAAPTATWNAVSMTLVSSKQHGGVGNVEAYIFGLASPATGAQSLVVDWSVTGGSSQCSLGVISLYNVNATTPFVNATSTSFGDVATTTGSLNVTSAANHLAILSNCTAQGWTWTDGSTSVYFNGSGTVNGGNGRYLTGAATVTFSATQASGDACWAAIDVSS